MRIIIALILLIVEESFFAAHPLNYVDPVKYFGDDKSLFLIFVLLLFGAGYPLMALILSEARLSLKSILLIIIIGIIEWLFVTSTIIILSFGLILLIRYFIGERWLLGVILLAAALFAVSLPLLILFFNAETFMDVAAFQHIIALNQSSNYGRYILNHLTSPDLYTLMSALWIGLPLLLIGPRMKALLYNRCYLYAVGLLLISVIIKSTVIQTESILSFHIIMMIAGVLQAAAIYIVLPRQFNEMTMMITLFIAEVSILLIFTGIGWGDYQLMSVTEVVVRAMIICIFSVVSLLLLNRMNRKSMKII